jgi:hypothetical protein
MRKASILVECVSFLLLFVFRLVNNICCLLSPFLAGVLGVGSGYLCAYWEHPSDSEKASVRGALSGGFRRSWRISMEYLSTEKIQGG